jgi:glycosyltransferase involved in cell wall biosynthesis
VILIEAFREGTPVIARDIGPFGEIVNRCNGGILFSNTDELRQAMRRLQERPDERREMGASARAGFERWWREAAVLQTYTRTLQRIALEKGRHHVAESLEA